MEIRKRYAMLKDQISKILKEPNVDNTWAIVKMSDVPNDVPVIAVEVYPSKSFAEFNLVEYCIVPKSLALKYQSKTK